MRATWMDRAAEKTEAIFKRHGIHLTLGGEPTYVPVDPFGAEWRYAAVGPTKLSYARRVAQELIARRMNGAVVFYCPGKSYPGEVNPRWVLRVVVNNDGTPFPGSTRAQGKRVPMSFSGFRRGLCKALGVGENWLRFTDPKDRQREVWAMPLDFGAGWTSTAWPLKPAELSEAEGPAGLRLPLHTIPAGFARRALTLERQGDTVTLFVPPLQQEPFLELLRAVDQQARKFIPGAVEFQGYIPPDRAGAWTQVGLTADPGVLEINIPPCPRWRDYADWISLITESCEAAGMRSWKKPSDDVPEGTGGGNHLLWGGPDIDRHPFFSRPAWLSSILRYWQHHPSLAYIFTGAYVGASSQAPRPDESATTLFDLEMAYAYLDGLPEGDRRGEINETLRHLHTDVTGNAHRSEISFDKFWNPGWPAGDLGLIEFRAIESLPRADWMSAIALLWNCLAARLLETGAPKKLARFDLELHDRFFLPTVLWNDFSGILADLRKSGFALDEKMFREIWNWRFPALLEWKREGAKFAVRKAHESWPLLCETPVDGGTTSRFVDTSMHRLEFVANEDFVRDYEIRAANRPLPLRELQSSHVAGLRYRRTNLYPSLHPGIPTQLPLVVTVINRKTRMVEAEFEMRPNETTFRRLGKKGSPAPAPARPCQPSNKGALTCDLRLK